MELSDKTYLAASLLIEVSDQTQERIADQKPHFSIKDWIKQMCTIKIGTSRGGGHTTMCLSLLKSKFRNGIIYMVPSIRIEQTMRDLAKKEGLLNKIIFSHPKSHVHKGANPNRVDAIIVDCANMFSRSLIEQVYEEARFFAAAKDKFFVILVE